MADSYRQGPEKVPPVTDPRWEAWSQPVLAYLTEPRSWKDLNAWCKSARFNPDRLRQCLAWLEEKGAAFSVLVQEKGGYVWISTAAGGLFEALAKQQMAARGEQEEYDEDLDEAVGDDF